MSLQRESGGGSGAGNQLSRRDEAKRWVGLREGRVLGVSAGLRRSPPGRDWRYHWRQIITFNYAVATPMAAAPSPPRSPAAPCEPHTRRRRNRSNIVCTPSPSPSKPATSRCQCRGLRTAQPCARTGPYQSCGNSLSIAQGSQRAPAHPADRNARAFRQV